MRLCVCVCFGFGFARWYGKVTITSEKVVAATLFVGAASRHVKDFTENSEPTLRSARRRTALAPSAAQTNAMLAP